LTDRTAYATMVAIDVDRVCFVLGKINILLGGYQLR